MLKFSLCIKPDGEATSFKNFNLQPTTESIQTPDLPFQNEIRPDPKKQ